MQHTATMRNIFAQAIVTAIGATGVRVVLKTAGDVSIATLTGGTSSATAETVTIPTASLTDDTNAVGGTLSYVMVEPAATGEVFRFDDVTVLGFSAGQVITAGDTVDCTGDITWTAPV
jgi:hypothetical protein